jgi:hypothetical protein
MRGKSRTTVFGNVGLSLLRRNMDSNINDYLNNNLNEVLQVPFGLSGATWSVIIETLESSIDFIIRSKNPGLAAELGDFRDLVMKSIDISIGKETA